MQNAIKPVMTFFDHTVQPKGLLTVADWRAYAQRHAYASWKTGARAYAQAKGGALILKADGALLVFTVLSDGRVRQKTYKADAWLWDIFRPTEN